MCSDKIIHTSGYKVVGYQTLEVRREDPLLYEPTSVSGDFKYDFVESHVNGDNVIFN